MQLDQLRYFLLIAQLGSINKACAQCHMSQQALNKSMKTLEAEVGCPLFDYHARGVALTEKGRLLAKTAEDVLQRMDEVLYKIRDAAPEERVAYEKLVFFFSPAVSQLSMTYVTKVFSQSHPSAQLTLIEEETAQIKQLILTQKEAAVGIISTIDAPDARDDTAADCLTVKIYEDKLYCVVSNQHPLARQKSVAMRTILKHPLAVYQGNYQSENPIRALLAQYGEPRYHIITNNHHMYRHAILHQGCVGFINQTALKRNAAFQDVLEEVLFLPINHIPPINISAVMTQDYYATHCQSIDDFFNLFKSLC